VGVHTGFHGGDHGGRSFIGVRPGPVILGRPPFFHRRPVVVSRTIVVGAPFFYYPPVYAAPVYPPVYQEPPAYIEQGPEVRYYCPDYRDYYPNVATCPSPWMQVLPDAGSYPN
jgi:hypothetical protein